jgi:hypothetical protein
MAGRDTLCAMAVQALASSHNSWRRLHTRRTAGVGRSNPPSLRDVPSAALDSNWHPCELHHQHSL